jgi:hypothetical protein
METMTSTLHSSPDQASKILAHLQSGGKLTPLDALQKFGCFRLGARIFELKKAGHQIEKKMVKVGNEKSVAEYRLVRNQPIANHIAL